MPVSANLLSSKIQQMLGERDLTITLQQGGFQVPFDSTAVNIKVIPQEDRTLIQMWVPVLRNVPPSAEMFEYIATKGQAYYFGHLRYVPEVEEGLIVFEHVLLGDYLDSDELHAALGGLATTGNDLDDELQKRFGGKRFADD